MKGATNSNLGGKALNLKEKIFKDRDLKIAGLYSEIFEEKQSDIYSPKKPKT